MHRGSIAVLVSILFYWLGPLGAGLLRGALRGLDFQVAALPFGPSHHSPVQSEHV